MKNRLGLQTVVGLLVISIAITACSGAASTPTSVAEVQEQGPAVQIGSAALGPDKTMSVCAGQTVALTTKTTGRDLTYSWSVDGKGQLERQEGKGDVASSNHYTAPAVSSEEVVKVTVTDDLNQSSNDQVIIQVVECETAEVSEGSTKEVTEEPPATVTITEPRSEVECPREAGCNFVIKGTSVGTVGNSNYKIVPFVNPSVGNPDTWFPQPDRPLGSDINEDGGWQAEVRIGTEAGEEPGHRFEIVVLVVDATTEIAADFQALPLAIAKSNIVNLVTVPPPPPGCSSARPPLEAAADFAGTVEITTPSSGTTGLPAESPILVAGTYDRIPDGVDIWVLAYPPNLIYYIQSPSACNGAMIAPAGGNWQVPVFLGTRDGTPECFDIVVVLADPEASQFFSDTVQQMCQSGHFYGIPAAQLEQMNITEKGFITVQTLD
jgi:hypothetical protein